MTDFLRLTCVSASNQAFEFIFSTPMQTNLQNLKHIRFLFVGFFVWWHVNFRLWFNAIAILIEEQQGYDLTHSQVK